MLVLPTQGDAERPALIAVSGSTGGQGVEVGRQSFAGNMGRFYPAGPRGGKPAKRSALRIRSGSRPVCGISTRAPRELLKRKQEGEKIEVPEERAPAKVINLMDALRRSVEAERAAEGRKAPAASVERRVAKKKPAKSSARHKRAG